MLPCSEPRLVAELMRLRLLDKAFDMTGVQSAAEVMGKSAGFVRVDFKITPFLVAADDASLMKEVSIRARKRVARWGVVNFEDFVATLKKAGLNAPDTLVREVLAAHQDLVWLDEPRRWFWLRDVPRNRLITLIEKVVVLAPRVRLSELRSAVSRPHIMKGFAVPKRILAALCAQLPSLTVEGDFVVATDRPPLERLWIGSQRLMIEILLANGGVMQRAALEEEALAQGVNESSFWVYLDFSPAFIRHAMGVYGLIGAAAPPELVESLARPRKLGKALQGFGWAKRDRPWLSYRLTESTLSSGHFTIPTALRRLSGSFELRVLNDAFMGKLVVRGIRATGLRPLFRRSGAEPGDWLVLDFDLKQRLAYVRLADSAAVMSGQELLDKSAVAPAANVD
ncbi:MAG: hypothetical protein WEB00_05575 [Dehalococcoidia bacterium]